jgi:hypothetical protein
MPRFRKTKIVCTIGPTSCTREKLFKLADEVRLAGGPDMPAGTCTVTRVLREIGLCCHAQAWTFWWGSRA